MQRNSTIARMTILLRLFCFFTATLLLLVCNTNASGRKPTKTSGYIEGYNDPFMVGAVDAEMSSYDPDEAEAYKREVARRDHEERCECFIVKQSRS